MYFLDYLNSLIIIIFKLSMVELSESKRFSTGTEVLDRLLYGGLEKGIITTFYGSSGSGKTNVALILAIHAARQGLKVAYIDTEGGFSSERVKQLTPDLTILKKIVVSTPTTFEEQGVLVRDLREEVKEGKVNVIIIDSFTMLYRLERPEHPEEINLELTKQCSILSSLARKHNILIVVTNQVYSKFKEREVKMVGGDILKYWSKSIIQLNKLEGGIRVAELMKHRSLPDGEQLFFKIIDEGLIEVKEPKVKRFPIF